ncbi:forkhead box protein A4-B-like [Littorina saxatilis]|uniref:forkhead box protein A4-B-like n=1 Tax=Littorina saxatilis TaxID=31220 RepID=UPI0038B5ED38
MVWLKDFALKKKPVVTDPLFSAEGPVNRRLESRPNKVFCICRSQSGWQPEVETLRKPPFKYKDLIEMALLSTPTLTMTSREIRTWFVKNFTFFKRHEKCGFWQHKLS